MIKLRSLFLSISGCLILYDCEKNVDFKLDEAEPKLVVDASIENGQAPLVTLTKSLDYFSTFTPQLLAQSFVHGADVFVSDGSTTVKLKEYAIPVTAGISVYYYTTDSSSPGSSIKGQIKKSYSLKIFSDGKEFTASTTIPDTSRKIDSLWWKPIPNSTDTTKAVVMIRATDPAGYGDYIRYYTRNQRQPVFYPPMNSVYDDLFIDGTTYEVQIQPGYNRNGDTTDKDFFYRRDTVNFNISNIDRPTFDFWRTWEYSVSSVGNPFSTPNKVLGNISNGALGYFGGYASQYRTLVIPR